MADDLDKKLKQIADMFGVSDTGSLKNIVESIVPPGQSAANADPQTDANTFGNAGSISSPPSNSFRSPGIDMNFLAKANDLLNSLNNVKDARITLLNSVQPFLRDHRKQRLNSAVQLLRVISVISSIVPSTNRNPKG